MINDRHYDRCRYLERFVRERQWMKDGSHKIRRHRRLVWCAFTRGHDIVSRVGGDEFLIIVSGDRKSAEAVCGTCGPCIPA